LRNNGNLHQTNFYCFLEIWRENSNGYFSPNPVLVLKDTIRPTLQSGTEAEFSFNTGDGQGWDEFVPQTYSQLPTYTPYPRSGKMTPNVTPRYQIKIYLEADQNNNNNQETIETRYYLKQSHTLNMLVSAENSSGRMWVRDSVIGSPTLGMALINGSASFTTDQIAAGLNYQYLTGESRTMTMQPGLSGIGYYTYIIRDNPVQDSLKIDVFERTAWEPRTTDYTQWRNLLWSDGDDKPTTRWDRRDLRNFLTRGQLQQQAKQNLIVSSQEFLREMVGWGTPGYDPAADDPTNPLDMTFTREYLRAHLRTPAATYARVAGGN
jgi:hypothetical protein